MANLKDLDNFLKDQERLRKQGLDSQSLSREQERLRQAVLDPKVLHDEQERLRKQALDPYGSNRLQEQIKQSISIDRTLQEKMNRSSSIDKTLHEEQKRLKDTQNLYLRDSERQRELSQLLQYPSAIEEQMKLLSKNATVSFNNNAYQLDKIREQIMKEATSFHPALSQAADAANRSALNIIRQIETEKSTLFERINLSSGWEREIQRLQETVVSRNDSINELISSRLSRITQTSLLAESALTKFDINRLGVSLNVSDHVRTSFSNRFSDFSSSYQQLFRAYERPETSLLTLPPALVELPTVEFFNGVELLKTTVDEETDKFTEQRELERENIREETADALATHLSNFNPKLLQLREGAKQAFDSNNPDRIRHCLTSLRELVREVLHYLSPDEEVHKWSTSKDDFDKGNPTRRGRLRYIARNISHGPFTDFVEKDIAATLEAISMFNKGTHAVDSSLTEPQVFALIAKVETNLLFIFQIANQSDS